VLPENRRKQIIEILKTKDYAEVSYLSDTFKVSEMTIRRDIDRLESEDLVVKVYGGVRLKALNEREWELPINERLTENYEAKNLVTDLAYEEIQDGDVIAFDASTTALVLSQKIKFTKKVTVITNNINIALELSEDPDISTILLGGFVRRTSLSLIGTGIPKYLESLYIDKAFISCKAINAEDGVMDSLMDEGEAKQAIIKRSKKIYILADHSKIATTAFFKICQPTSIDYLITDELVNTDSAKQQCLQQYIDLGVDVQIAKE